jgi:hypothetical protein
MFVADDQDSTPDSVTDREPWYYRFASSYINIVMWIILVSIGLGWLFVNLILFGTCLTGYLPGGFATFLAASACWSFYCALVALGFLFMVALYLIFVDIGRQLRRLNATQRS